MADLERSSLATAAADLIGHVGTSMSTNDVKDYYDKLSSSYDQILGNYYCGSQDAANALAEIVTDKAAFILDCGCGTGQTGELLHKRGYVNIHGVDMSEKSLQVARDKGAYVNLMAAKMGPEPLEGVKQDSYDAVVSSGCFIGVGHLDDSVLTEWTRIVKPGGHIVIVNRSTHVATQLLEGTTFKQLIASEKLELIYKRSCDYYVPGNKKQEWGSGFAYLLKVMP
ncbi:methyltransferase-like protein 27 [Ptychodera flava]|uniref:methyltransferase-like protein 27 n=1 Tax=Ptychodera flava TaxID=63121 RepID=UPI003969FCC2